MAKDGAYENNMIGSLIDNVDRTIDTGVLPRRGRRFVKWNLWIL